MSDSSDAAVGDIFDRLDPGDGCRIERVELPKEGPSFVGLYATASLGGELRALGRAADGRCKVYSVRDPTPNDLGELARLQPVLEAVCRYLTVGGSWLRLETALARLRDAVPGGLVFPGYYLHDTWVNSEGGHEHFFVKSGADHGVLWVEDLFIERKTIEAVYREQEEEEESEGGPGFSPRAAEDPHHPEKLLDRADPGRQGSDHGEPGGGI